MGRFLAGGAGAPSCWGIYGTDRAHTPPRYPSCMARHLGMNPPPLPTLVGRLLQYLRYSGLPCALSELLELEKTRGQRVTGARNRKPGARMDTRTSALPPQHIVISPSSSHPNCSQLSRRCAPLWPVACESQKKLNPPQVPAKGPDRHGQSAHSGPLAVAGVQAGAEPIHSEWILRLLLGMLDQIRFLLGQVACGGKSS